MLNIHGLITYGRKGTMGDADNPDRRILAATPDDPLWTARWTGSAAASLAGWMACLMGDKIEAKEKAMIELTEEQRQDLTDAEPIAVDPLTREEYVLVRRIVYDRLRGLLEDDAVLASAEMVDKVMAEDDANDPYLAEYQSITREGKQ